MKSAANRALCLGFVILASSPAVQAEPLPADGHGLFRTWTYQPSGDALWMEKPFDQYPLKSKAREMAAKWDANDRTRNYLLLCIPPGMPATMGNALPMEFVDKGADIELHNEEFDIVRTIHLNIDVAPQDEPYSPLGYSVGHWEGDTLVVYTNRIDTPYFNRAGVPLSRQAEVTERFTPNAEKGKLDYELTVTDPENLAQPFVQTLTWFWNPATRVQRYNCDTRE